MSTPTTAQALQALLDRYTSLVNCGDCGNWNPETEPCVIAARAALSAAPPATLRLTELLREASDALESAHEANRLLLNRARPPKVAAAGAPQDAGAPPADPMDWPLPCDVTVGHGTMRKGVRLGALVTRMKVLYEMATGDNADEVAARTPAQRGALFDQFQRSITEATDDTSGIAATHDAAVALEGDLAGTTGAASADPSGDAAPPLSLVVAPPPAAK